MQNEFLNQHFYSTFVMIILSNEIKPNLTNMKKGLLITIGIIVVIVFILYRLFAGSYNNMVTKEEQVTGAWSQV